MPIDQPWMEVDDIYQQLAHEMVSMAWRQEARGPDQISGHELESAIKQFHHYGEPSCDIEQGFLVYSDKKDTLNPRQIEEIWPGICWGTSARGEQRAWIYYGDSVEIKQETEVVYAFVDPVADETFLDRSWMLCRLRRSRR